jgi:hypothetical protein
MRSPTAYEDGGDADGGDADGGDAAGCEEDGGDLARELVPNPALLPLPAPAWP